MVEYVSTLGVNQRLGRSGIDILYTTMTFGYHVVRLLSCFQVGITPHGIHLGNLRATWKSSLCSL